MVNRQDHQKRPLKLSGFDTFQQVYFSLEGCGQIHPLFTGVKMHTPETILQSMNLAEWQCP